MKFYVMRHADAVSSATWGKTDAARPLSKRGRKDLENALPGMRQEAFSFCSILSSPYQRARETAEIISSVDKSVEIVLAPELAAGASVSSIKKAVELFKEREPALVIGHIPDLAVFIGRVVGKADVQGTGLAQGEIVALETPGAEIHWSEGTILWRKRLDEWGRS